MFSVNISDAVKEKAVDWHLAEQRSRGLDIFRLSVSVQESPVSFPGNNVERHGRHLNPNFLRSVTEVLWGYSVAAVEAAIWEVVYVNIRDRLDEQSERLSSLEAVLEERSERLAAVESTLEECSQRLQGVEKTLLSRRRSRNTTSDGR